MCIWYMVSYMPNLIRLELITAEICRFTEEDDAFWF